MKEHLFAPTLTFAFFIFLLILGRAFFELTKTRMRGVACWLLSPAMGLAVLGLLSGTLNQIGLPIHSFGAALVAILSVLSVLILWWRKCHLPLRRLTIGAVAVLLWLGMAGFPLFLYGGEWLSFVNDDFTNYCVGATRLLNHGFFDLPTEAQLREGKDLSARYWTMHVGMGARPVTDFVLAVVSAAGRTSPREAFMPVIFVFALTQAGALGGLLALSHRFRRATGTALFILLCSPMFILGTYYQLIAQVGGLALLLLSLALLVRSTPELLWRKSVSCLLPVSSAVAALIWFYPECAPFGLIPAAAMMFLALIKRPSRWRPFLGWVALSSLLVLGILHLNTPMILNFLMRQAGQGMASSTNDIFPYFLSRAGWVRTMGWTTFFGSVPPFLWVPAFALMAAALFSLLRKCRVIQGLFGVGAVMSLITITLTLNQNGFSLFKMAMFAQPVLAAGLALLVNALPSRLHRFVLLSLWLVSTIPASVSYLSYSLGKPGGPCETPFATRLGFPEDHEEKGAGRIINMSAGQEKLTVLNSPERLFTPTPLGLSGLHQRTSNSVYFAEEEKEIVQMITGKVFQAPDEINLIYFEPPSVTPGSSPSFLMEPHSLLRPFNRFFETPGKSGWFSISKIEAGENQNRLAWVPSAHVHHSNPVALLRLWHYQGIKTEQDVADANGTFWATKRRLLFDVVQPTPEIYLRVNFTRTYCGSGRVFLPEATVRGVNQQRLPFSGGGCANVIVGPVEPSRMNGKALVSLDLGMPEQQFFKGDKRNFCGWMRDVSAMSPDRYHQLLRPSAVRVFPDDLLHNPALEYSGIYEDGAISQESWVGLSNLSHDTSMLFLEGEIPPLPELEAGNQLNLSIDGVPLRTLEVGAGRFSLSVELPPSDKSWNRFDLKWAKICRFPTGDDRPVAARLSKIEAAAMSPDAYQKLVRPAALRVFPDDLFNKPGLEYSGIFGDGILGRQSWVGLSTSSSEPSLLILEGEIPYLPGLEAGNRLNLSIDGVPFREIPVGSGHFSVSVELPASGKGWTRFDLNWAESSRFPAGDGRPVAARLLKMEVSSVK